MKTQSCQLFAYCETSGAPVGICSLAQAQVWHGAEHEQTHYWNVVESIGQELLFDFDSAHQFFNTESGNFALYRSSDGLELVLAEIIHVEKEEVPLWPDVSFSCNAATKTSVKLQGLTCFFDAALSVPSTLLPYTSLYAVDQAAPWNIAVLDCDYDTPYEVEFKSDNISFQGICFRKELA